MDDIIVPSKDEEEGLEKLKRVFKVAEEYGLEINFKKCQFLKRKIEYLGYIIENGTIKPSPSKTNAIKNYPKPMTVIQVQSFLGLTSYFRKFIPGYSNIAKPLSDLLRDNVKFQFKEEQEQAFQTLKDCLSSEPVLQIFRQGAPLEVHTDASSHGFGAVLLQEDDEGVLHPVHYMSKKTNAQQEKYSSYELEILAVVEALKKFRVYLLGSKFKIVTDCNAFQKTMSKKDIIPKIARWALMLEEFDYELIHRSGKQMKHVDALSRNTVLMITRSQEEVTAKIAAAQNEDDYVATIKKLIDEGVDSSHMIRQGVLYKQVDGRDLVVVPQSMQIDIVKKIHQKGHFGAAKTEDLLKQEFFIPQARKHIEHVIANCVECILVNRKRGKGEGLLNPIPKEDVPFSTYHIDFIGPLPSTKKNYVHIFAVVDAFTKFAWFYPVKTTSAQEAIQKLRLQQTTFGNPRRIISDRGSAFTSKEFNDFCEEEQIEHVVITTGIPRGNGQVERIFGTITPVLAKLAKDEPTKWFKYVPEVQRIMNSTISRATKYTPFELMTGMKMRNKDDLKIKEILEEENKEMIWKDREALREDAKANILKLQEENRRQFNRRRKKARKYNKGDLVAIQRTQSGPGLKLRSKFLGPYRVTKVKPNDRYDVEKVGIHEGPMITSTAADHMKPWVQN